MRQSGHGLGADYYRTSVCGFSAWHGVRSNPPERLPSVLVTAIALNFLSGSLLRLLSVFQAHVKLSRCFAIQTNSRRAGLTVSSVWLRQFLVPVGG